MTRGQKRFKVSSFLNLKKLVILELPRSRMRMMFELHKACPVFEKLKILNMSDSLNLISTPDFSCNSSLVAYTLTKRLLQIFSGFGHIMIIYIEPTGFPDWISRSSNSDFPSMASHDILAMIFCFKLSKYLYEIDYSVKNITSDFRWSESLSMPHGFDSVVMFIVPRSIFSIRDGDYGVELTSNLKIIHGIHLLYEPEITVVGESSSTTVNVEDERCYPCKHLKHSESDKNWHSLPLSSSHEIPLIDGNYSVVGYLQQQIMDSSDDDSLVYEVNSDSTNVEELNESVEEMMSNSESEPNIGAVPWIDLTNEFSDKKNVSTVPTTTQQSPLHLLDYQPLANIASEPAIQSTGTILDNTSDPRTSTGIGTSNSNEVSGIDRQQELCDKVSYLECDETYKALEMNTLCDYNKMLEARLARNKLQMDHMNHAYNSSFDHLLSRVNTLPSVVPGGTTIERGDVKNVLQHVLQDFAQNATSIEKLFGDREG
ncbi:hypothetical protein POM88_019890 [Heracleum sosnowskyi]|uniref:Uncharacterized protein n=1 Tax=Heracleum sosnowskyi TaxID=360622 RepID=A0AAD8MMK5_9APIA|nr:hypothetical protein POM88_019890 [Heracleum sosnowskyi]